MPSVSFRSSRDGATEGTSMTPAIQEQLQATGRVQVIVVLKKSESSVRLSGALESASIPGPLLPTEAEKRRFRKTAQGLQGLFIASADSREGALALAVALDARRRGEQPRSSALESTADEAARPLPVMASKTSGSSGDDRSGRKSRALSADSRVQTVTAAPELSLIRP